MSAKWVYGAKHHLVTYTRRVGSLRVVLHRDNAAPEHTPWKCSVYLGAGQLAGIASKELSSSSLKDARKEGLSLVRVEIARLLQDVSDAIAEDTT